MPVELKERFMKWTSEETGRASCVLRCLLLKEGGQNEKLVTTPFEFECNPASPESSPEDRRYYYGSAGTRHTTGFSSVSYLAGLGDRQIDILFRCDFQRCNLSEVLRKVR